MEGFPDPRPSSWNRRSSRYEKSRLKRQGKCFKSWAAAMAMSKGSDKDQVLTVHGEAITLEEATRRFDLSPVIRRFGTWAVTTYGVECLVTYYPIRLSRVEEPDWL